MALIIADRVRETTTTTGTGAVTLAGAVSGYQTFGSRCSNGDNVFYCIAHQTGTDWEVGFGTWNTGGTLTRTTVLKSSNADAVVNLSAGTKDVFITLPADYTGQFNNERALVMTGVSSVPATAATNQLKFYARNRAGRMFPEIVGPAGIDTSLQPALFGNNVTMWLPGVGTTAAINFGVSWTVGATQAHPTIATTNFMTQMKRATYTTTTTAGNASGIRSAAAVCWRGNAAGQGGFFFFARFGVLNHNAAFQHWIGLSALTGILAGEPSAQNNSVFVGKDIADTNWQIVTRDGTTANKTNTGVAVAAGGTGNIFDIMFFCKPNDTQITARMVNITTGAVVVDNQVLTTNLPTSTSLLVAHAETRNGSTGAASAIFLNRIYIESDT